ncbi:MAG: PAS domain S-box protein [Phycisphaerae bacterium]
MGNTDFREIFDLTEIALLHCDQAGRILLANPAARKMLDLDFGQLVPDTVSDLFHPQHRSEIRAACHGLAREHAFRLHTSLAGSSEQKVVLIAKSMRAPRGDILFQIQPEDLQSWPDGPPQRSRALQSIEERLWKIFTTSPIGLCITRICDGQIVEVNNSFLEMIGYRREEVLGQTTEQLDLWVDLNHYSRILSTLGKNRRLYGEEFPFRTKLGEIRYGLCFYDSFELEGERHVLAEIQDITQRKLAEEAMLESQQRMEALFSNALDAIMLIDNEGQILEANPASCQLMGRSYEDIVGRAIWQLTSPQTGRQLERDWLSFLRTGQMQGQLVLPGAQDTAVEAEHLSVANFVPGLHMMVLRDVTDRNRAERKQRQSQADLRALFDSSVQGVILIDREGIVRDFNARAELFVASIGGRLEKARPGAGVLAVDPEAEQSYLQNFAAALGGKSSDWDWQFTGQQGSQRCLSMTYAPVTGDDDQVEGVCLSLLDITDTKRAERQLRGTRDQLESIIDSLPYATFVIDNQGRILAWNRELEQLTGYAKEDMVGKDNQEYAIPFYGKRRRLSIDLIDHPDEEIERAYDVVRRQGQQVYTEIYLPQIRNGQGAHLAATASPLYDSEGRRTGAIESVQDITQRKQAEEQLRESEEQLRHAQRMEAVGRLAGGIAHDFNNQMTVVEGYCDLLMREVPEDSDIVEPLMEIHRASSRATRLTSQLLTFSRRQVLRPEVLRLPDLLKDIENPLARMIGEDIKLSILCPDEVGRVVVDQNQFQQVVMNLAINARDAMPTGGELTLELADMTVDAEMVKNHPEAALGPHVMLAVRDTGMGMDEETRAHAFDPFFTTKPVGQGTGLGLAMVYGFVSQSGGFVDLDSSPGEGTEFRIYLPRADAETEAEEEIPTAVLPNPPVTGSGRVLIVEDEERVRRLVTQVLDRCGYQVHNAADVAAALSYFESNADKIDLVVSDVVMPGGSGLDLAEKIRDKRPDLPILFISGYAHDTVLQHGEGTLPEKLLAKPFTPQQLSQAVKDLLQRAPAE